ncbi:MAG: Re/Si-specific NAD(P)(+) transhydrogenase subunit alpha [Polyangiales bacterium]
MPKIFVPKEHTPGERRVAATPESAKRLVKEGFALHIEAGAGAAAHYGDDSYTSAGATVVQTGEVGAEWSSADVVLKVNPLRNGTPVGDEATLLKQGALFIGFTAPYANAAMVETLRARGVNALGMELVPRISRAQSMDALSSQASIAGYKAVLLAAAELDKYFPLLMTAAGTVQPARVVVMGAGVAGLQAVATARRLGAIVEVSDIRPAVKEQVESLGGKFIDLPMLESGEGQGGYAKEVTPEFLAKQQAIVRERVVLADVVITTALVPGRPAPKLIPADMVQAMRTGAVIVDLAVVQGGNCALSEADKTVVKEGVTILGPSNLPASMPADASHLYARNVMALLLLVGKGGEIKLDLEDELVRGALLTHQGEVMHGPTAERLKGAA